MRPSSTTERCDEGLRQLVTSEQLWGDAPTDRLGQIALAYSHVNRPQDAQRVFNELQRRARGTNGNVGDNIWAMAYLALGDYDEALQRLESLMDDDSVAYAQLGQIKANDYNDPVLEQPRWQELRDRICAP